MDGDDRRTSQYGQPYQNPRLGRPAPGQPMGPPTTDRYAQQSTPIRAEPGRPTMTRSFVPGYSYGYQEQQYTSPSLHGSSPMQGVEMQYSPAYVQDVPRQHHIGQPQPSYGHYGQGSILPSSGQQPMYDTMPHYQRTQSAAIEVMTSHMGGLPQYMSPTDQSAISMQPSTSHYVSSQSEQTSYPSVAVSRASMTQYGATATDYSAVEQPSSQPSAEQQNALEQGLREYELQLRRTFDVIIAGRVNEAADKLLGLSRWLIGAVVNLGLHHDDESKHDERLELWRQFNLCWEALGLKQKDLTEEAIRTRRQSTDLLSASNLKHMITELVTMNDSLEPHGLIDYEMGIAEEQITHIFTNCLELLQNQESANQQGQDPGSGSKP